MPVLFYQDFKDTFVCYTQRTRCRGRGFGVVLSGFQRYFCMLYTTQIDQEKLAEVLFYQDFNEQFEGIISYDIEDYGMHLSHMQLFHQFLL